MIEQYTLMLYYICTIKFVFVIHGLGINKLLLNLSKLTPFAGWPWNLPHKFRLYLITIIIWGYSVKNILNAKICHIWIFSSRRVFLVNDVIIKMFFSENFTPTLFFFHPIIIHFWCLDSNCTYGMKNSVWYLKDGV